jgi:hypothetical protein
MSLPNDRLENLMKKISIAAALGLAAGLCVAYPAAAAGKFDGTAALICAATTLHECVTGETCQPQIPEQVGLPTLLRVDFAGKKLHPLEPLANRDSTIRSVYHVNGRTVVSGGESGRGWVVTINEQTGRMSAAVVTDGEGFVIFGQCAVQ